MEIAWLFAILVLSLFGFFLLFTIKDAIYFRKRGIIYLGNMNYPMILRNLNLADNSLYWYNKAKNQNISIAGLKELLTPTIMVTDPDLIKKIMVKDFEHFVDRRPFELSDRDYLLKRFLALTSGEHWKFLRTKVTPAMSSGKVRRMFQIFDTSSKKLVHHLKQEIINCGQINLEESFVKFATDVTASSAFGFDSMAFDLKENSEFHNMGQKLRIKCKGLEIVKFLLMEILPKKFTKLLGLTAFSLEAQSYFSRLVKSEIKRRNETGENKEDFIQIMLEAKKGKMNKLKKKLTDFEKETEIKTAELDLNKFVFNDDDITAQSVTFILAGSDATTSTLLFLAYVLALHGNVQDRLFQEIYESLEEAGGEFTYELINQMEYLDMVLNETLRIYAPVAITNRTCTKDYKIPNSNLIIKKDEIIFIAILAMQNDAKNFEEPDRFDPERWTAANRSKFHPYAFLPFGHGLRNCPGLKLASVQTKLAIAHLVHNFIIEPSEKTSIPMEFGSSMILTPRDGMWITLIKRT